MSDPTLCQIDYGAMRKTLTAQLSIYLVALETEGVLVPVERCEHGMIDGHSTRDGYEPRGWCEGAGIGDNDEPR